MFGFAGILGVSVLFVYFLDSADLCNVRGITLYGDLITTTAHSMGTTQTISDDVLTAIQEAKDDETIRGLILDIDSNGGQPVAAEEIAHAIQRLDKPAVALIRSSGLSAAYWVATGADIIFASKNSDVGSIGVILPIVNEIEKNKKEGVEYSTITSARYKDIGDPSRLMTEEERSLLQRDIDVIHNNFVDAIAENRKIPREKVAELADGYSLLGTAALEKGLIDRIGDQHDAEQYLADLIGEPVEICWGETATEEDSLFAETW